MLRTQSCNRLPPPRKPPQRAPPLPDLNKSPTPALRPRPRTPTATAGAIMTFLKWKVSAPPDGNHGNGRRCQSATYPSLAASLPFLSSPDAPSSPSVAAASFFFSSAVGDVLEEPTPFELRGAISSFFQVWMVWHRFLM